MITLTAEPSPPLESPTKALEEIQVHLSRLEVPNPPSSMLRNMPDAADDLGTPGAADDMERSRLLEKLERELDEQEVDWQKLQRYLGRDSLSSIGSPPSQKPDEESGNDGSRRRSSKISQIPSRNMSRRAQARDSLAGIANIDTIRMPESIPQIPRLSVWQQRLAKAQISHEENAPEFSRRPNLNFLSFAKAPKPQLGSPTPPESEDEDEFEAPILDNLVFSATEVRSLWQPRTKSQGNMKDQLWQPPIATKISIQSPETPAKDLRPKPRSKFNELRISTFSLWSRSEDIPQNTTVKGLWGSDLPRPLSVKARPVTQRPLRRPKRMTLLADIGA